MDACSDILHGQLPKSQRGSHIAQALTALRQQRSQDVVSFCSEKQTRGHELYARVAAIAEGLRRLGVQEDQRVAIVGLNSQCYLECLLAISAAGAIATLLNTRWSVGEAREALRQVAASALILDAECLPWWGPLSASCPGLNLGLFMGVPPQNGDLHRELVSLERLTSGGALRSPLALTLRWGPGGIAAICFTSGTTGTPKGVALSHDALVSQSLAKIAVVGYGSDDVYLHTAPLCHIGGLSSALALLMACGTHVFLPRFRASAVRAAMDAHRVTALIAVPAMLADLVMQAPRSSADAPSVRYDHVRTLLVGGGGMPPAMARAVEKFFPAARIMLAYGMTEAASSMTFQMVRERPQLGVCESPSPSPGLGSARSATSGRLGVADGGPVGGGGGVCVGRPAPHVEICIVPPGAAAAVGSSEEAEEGISRSADRGANCSISGESNRDPGASPGENSRNIDASADESNISPSGNSGSAGASSGESNRSSVEVEEVGEIPVWFGGAGPHGGASGEGEIWTRGPHVMAGYWGRPADTWRVLRSDGWLRTGDIGRMDPLGRLWLCGRLKDTVRSGGENVHATEVEAVLCTHPSITAAAVVGLPDPRLGEAVAALVTLQAGWAWVASRESSKFLDQVPGHGAHGRDQEVSLEMLRGHCQSKGLSRFKVPKLIASHEGPLPTTSTGKVKKDEVKNLLLEKIGNDAPRQGDSSFKKQDPTMATGQARASNPMSKL